MYQRQAIHKNCNIVAVVMVCALILTNHILIDDLKTVVVNLLFVDEHDVLRHGIIAL